MNAPCGRMNPPLEIREAEAGDLEALLALYTHLHESGVPAVTEAARAAWADILADKRQHVLLGVMGGEPVSSCVLAVIPNLTQGPRPYALVENVVTRADCRGRGYASALLDRAGELAARAGCYKIMLMTGSKEESTLSFYRRAGYNDRDKTAFIRWL